MFITAIVNPAYCFCVRPTLPTENNRYVVRKVEHRGVSPAVHEDYNLQHDVSVNILRIMLYLIGLGLGDAKDITVKGLEIIRRCDRVYLESYTSILDVQQETLEEFYGRPLIVADRELVENNADDILPRKGCDEDVAFLVVGDPFAATTHTDLILRAKESGIEVRMAEKYSLKLSLLKNLRDILQIFVCEVQIVHNASILTAIGCCGLQLYSFGETVSIPYWTDTWEPDSFYYKIASNRQRGLHTLCLLDIKVKEPTLESILRKKKEYMPPKFMSVKEAAAQLIAILDKLKNNREELAFTSTSLTVGLARVGCEDQRVVACSLHKMTNVDLGPPLHCLIITAEKLHPLELDFITQFAIEDSKQFKQTNEIS